MRDSVSRPINQSNVICRPLPSVGLATSAISIIIITAIPGQFEPYKAINHAKAGGWQRDLTTRRVFWSGLLRSGNTNHHHRQHRRGRVVVFQ